MIPPSFEYARPGSVEETVRVLSEGGEDAKVLVEADRVCCRCSGSGWPFPNWWWTSVAFPGWPGCARRARPSSSAR